MGGLTQCIYTPSFDLSIITLPFVVVVVVVVVEMFKVSKMTAKQQAAIYIFFKTKLL